MLTRQQRIGVHMQAKFIHYQNMKIKADIGKVFRRIADKQVFGDEVVLGYNYVLHGQILPKAYLELPEHYEQIDEPVTEETIILDEEKVMEEILLETPQEPFQESSQAEKVTIADYRALEEKVNQLMNIINGGVK